MYRLFWAATVYLLAPKGGPVVRYTYMYSIVSCVGVRARVQIILLYIGTYYQHLQTSNRETPTGGAAR